MGISGTHAGVLQANVSIHSVRQLIVGKRKTSRLMSRKEDVIVLMRFPCGTLYMTKRSAVSIPTTLFIELLNHLHFYGSPHRDPDDAVTEAVEQWLRRAFEDLFKPRGYTWKDLWLQDGTELRMRYKGQTYYARVHEDDLLYDGSPISPAQMVNAITGTNRNAWRDLWIKAPGESEFIPAEQERSRSRERSLDKSKGFARRMAERSRAQTESDSTGRSDNSQDDGAQR